jgi:hypothetical protein
MVEAGNTCRILILVGKHDGEQPLGRPRIRLEDNIKMDITETVVSMVGR